MTETKARRIRPVRNRDMSLDVAVNCRDGIDRIGCRASGVFEGHAIERTVWTDADRLSAENMANLRVMATGLYREEVAAIRRRQQQQEQREP